MIKILIPFLSAYTLKRFKIFKEEDANPLINYVIYFAIPFLAFKSAYSLGIEKNIFKLAVAAWLIILTLMGIAYISGYLLKLKGKDLRLWILVNSLGNTGFLGYPFSYSYFGEKGLHFAVMYDSLGSVVLVLTLGIFIASEELSIKTLFSFPPTWALILGFLAKPFVLPHTIKTIINFVEPSVFPVIMFAIGLCLDLSEIKNYIKQATSVEMIKIFGGATLGLIYGSILNVAPLPLKIIIIEASMPTMIFTIVLSIKYKLNYKFAISCASLGIIFSFFTTPLIVKLMHYFL